VKGILVLIRSLAIGFAVSVYIRSDISAVIALEAEGVSRPPEREICSAGSLESTGLPHTASSPQVRVIA